jgi:uncharacterized membrane protein YidH (DUF202 family)
MTDLPGQSRERTAIAWGRTALSSAALGVLLLKLGVQRTSPADLAAASIALLMSAALAHAGRTSFRRDLTEVPLLPIRAVTAAMVAIGTLAIVGTWL